MSFGGWSDPDDENWDDNGWEAPRHGSVFAIPGHMLGEPVPPTQNHDGPPDPPPEVVIPPDPDFGGEWRLLPVCGRAKGASKGSASNGSASNGSTCRYHVDILSRRFRQFRTQQALDRDGKQRLCILSSVQLLRGRSGTSLLRIRTTQILPGSV